MANKQGWLDAALVILVEQGAPGITIERLTERTGLSKGSFYHHFEGIGGFQSAILAHFETETTTRFIEAAEQLPLADPVARLKHLIDLVVVVHPQAALEVAVRAWALQDGQARAVQERVDRTRIEYLRELWRDTGAAPEEAAQLANLLYLVMIGARQVIPPLPAGELRQLCTRILSIASLPSVIPPARSKGI